MENDKPMCNELDTVIAQFEQTVAQPTATDTAAEAADKSLEKVVFDPSLVSAVGASLFGLVRDITGHDYWELSEAERRVVGRVLGPYLQRHTALRPEQLLDIQVYIVLALMVGTRVAKEFKPRDLPTDKEVKADEFKA